MSSESGDQHGTPKEPKDGAAGSDAEGQTAGMPVSGGEAGDFFADRPVAVAIEGYQVLREISHGGQGVVYQAVQQSTQRKVALKVLLEGPYASKSSRLRFEREIDLVSHLKHPNIIAVFDSGTTSDGRLFYVMDYVRGMPVTEYIRSKRLSLRQTLQLFAAICEAVNHAHQKGVIHRDLKPSNVLVDSEGNPHILDFGLAKAITERAETLATISGQVMGTLPYMSPEQTQGNPEAIDTRTDVYALGVILYELLTGKYPYPVAGQMAEVLRHIAETPPTPPSRSWTVAAGVGPAKTGRPGRCPIDDEVETIALKSLSKERERRYQSAGELAKDIRHYLSNEPIEAKRDSAMYLFKKALWRYRVPVGMGVFILVMPGILAAVMTVQRNRAVAAEEETRRQRDEASRARDAEAAQRKEAENQRDRATKAEADALAVLGFFQDRVLAAARPKGQDGGLGRDATIRAAVDAAEPAISASIGDRPEVEASIRNVMGLTYHYLGECSAAARQHERALSLYRSHFGPDHPDTLMSMNNLASAYKDAGRAQDALPLYEDTLKLRKVKLGPDHPDTLFVMDNLTDAYTESGLFSKAAASYERRLQADSQDHSLHVRYACLLAQVGDRDRYRDHCNAMLKRFEKTQEREIADRVAKASLFLSREGIDLAKACALGDRAVSGPPHQWTHYFEVVKGLAEYRSGRCQSAADWLSKSANATRDTGARWCFVEAALCLGMSQFRLGKVDEGSRLLTEAERVLDGLPKPGEKGFEVEFADWIICRTLRREAESLIKPQPTSQPATRPAAK